MLAPRSFRWIGPLWVAGVLSQSLSLAQFGAPTDLTGDLMLGGLAEPGDVDGDGDEDVLVGDRHGRLSWRENLGGGLFGLARTIDSREYIRDLAPADVDGDGDQDLLVVASVGGGATLDWYEFLGSSGFAPPRTIDGALTGSRLDVVDMDGDGDVDVVSHDSGGEVFWIENVSAGQFGASRRPVSTNEGPVSAIRAADYDGDGDTDVVTAANVGFAYAFVVHENLGNAVFVRDVVLSIFWCSYFEFASGDLDGDGDLDLVGASQADRFDRYEQTAPLEFVNRYQFPAPTEGVSVDVGDVDGDGDLDVLTFARDLEWNENDGSVSYVNHPITTLSAPRGRARLADLDGSGTLDVLWSTQFGVEETGWHRNLGGGTFAPSELLSTPDIRQPAALASADFDRDGFADLVAVASESWRVVYFKGTGPGEFAEAVELDSIGALATAGLVGLEAHDLDQDGDLDIVASLSNRLQWFENLGGAPADFAAAEVLWNFQPQSSPFTSFSVRDVNGDGWLDLLGTISSNTRSWVLPGTGPATFATSAIEVASINGWATDIDAADFDGDGDLDLVLTVDLQDSVIYVETLPNWTFAQEVTVMTGVTDAFEVVPVDVDGDGLSDLVASGVASTRWARGNGDGTFASDTEIGALGLQGGRSVLAVSDVDGDGRADVIVSAQPGALATSTIAWARNLGQGMWGAGGAFMPQNDRVSALHSADADGDLDLDLFVASRADDRITLYPNDAGASGAFCGPAVTHSGGAAATITGTGSTAVADDDLTLRAVDLPLGVGGYFLASRTQGLVPQPAGSQGVLCLGGSIGRYVSQLGNTGSSGTLDLIVLPGVISQPMGPVAPAPGETWSFQCWFRDQVAGSATSNFSAGYAVRFR